jgi:hypothetical protein
VFKSDHEFSPESDLENEDSEAQPTRRARTAQKGKLNFWCYETFSFITASVIIHHICYLHSHFPRCSCYYCCHFIILFISRAGAEPNPLLLWPFNGLFYQSWMIDGDDCGAVSGLNEWQRKAK